MFFYSVAQFTNADNITRVAIAAEFFLKLHPALLFDIESISEIEAITRKLVFLMILLLESVNCS